MGNISFITGRGWGKTRTACETLAAYADGDVARNMALIAPTYSMGKMVYDRMMRETVYVNDLINCPKFSPGANLFTWKNGATCRVISSDSPHQVRSENLQFVYPR